MIVYGWNHFKIKSFKPVDLGIPYDGQEDISIEYRQKYFHLFWIPFIGIGKMWGLRKASDSSNLYEIPEELKNVLNQQQLPATPWYSFAGLILIAGIAMWIYIVDKF
jgi:hypothetical protein